MESIINIEALNHALQCGIIKAVDLDTFEGEEEPLPEDSPLRTILSFVLSPHTTYKTEESRTRLHKNVVNTAVRIMRGEFRLI